MPRVFDAVVVGAGPAGGMAARSLSAAGFRTLILEKKRVVGEPVQCAEGVSRFGLESNGLTPRPEWVAQPIKGALCIVPNGKSFRITDLPGYAIDRIAFDAWVVAGAVERGAELQTSTRVTGIRRLDEGWALTARGQEVRSRIVIAADGPTAFLARNLGLLRRQDYILAYEYRIPRAHVALPDPDRFALYVAQRFRGGYAWIFPRGESVNVGAGGPIDARAAALAFCREHGIDPDRRELVVAGIIPSHYDLVAYAIPGFAVVGDAAGVTNPMNGAGIHPALFSGRLAGEFAADALEREDPSAIMGYDRALRASPFLDPLLGGMVGRIRRWSDRLLNDVGDVLDGLDWKAVNWPMVLSTLLRKPWLAPHGLEFIRMIRALELCEHFGW